MMYVKVALERYKALFGKDMDWLMANLPDTPDMEQLMAVRHAANARKSKQHRQ